MLASLATLTIAILITLYEIPPLLKKRLLKEIITFFILLSIGTFLTILMTFGVQLPNPLNWIIALFQPLATLMDYLLK